MDLSLIIPAYNEANKIGRDLEEAARFYRENRLSGQVLVVDDGSKDLTQLVAERAAESLHTSSFSIQVLSYGNNRGKGYAIRYGVEHAEGDVIAFADAGLCVPFKYLLDGMKIIKQGAGVAIASRRHASSDIQRSQPFYRQWGSKVFWYVIQWGMGVKVSDTQCGFKLYSREAAKKIFSRLKTDGFMFDIEALIIAKQLDLSVGEFAIQWANDSDTRYQLIWGTLRNIKELARIRIRSLYA